MDGLLLISLHISVIICYTFAPFVVILTGFKLVWEQENPIQEKHRQVSRRGQHVRSEDCSQRNQRVRSRQPGKLSFNSQLSRWAPSNHRPLDCVKGTVHLKIWIQWLCVQTHVCGWKLSRSFINQEIFLEFRRKQNSPTQEWMCI